MESAHPISIAMGAILADLRNDRHMLKLLPLGILCLLLPACGTVYVVPQTAGLITTQPEVIHNPLLNVNGVLVKEPGAVTIPAGMVILTPSPATKTAR